MSGGFVQYVALVFKCQLRPSFLAFFTDKSVSYWYWNVCGSLILALRDAVVHFVDAVGGGLRSGPKVAVVRETLGTCAGQ